MRGRTNTTGVKESDGTFELLNEGEYLFEIAEVGESTTQSGDPMGKLVLVVKDGEYKGQKVWDNIVIPNEGSKAWKIMGRTKFFLHCIGEPFEGEFDWDSARWLYKTVRARIRHEVQKEGKYAGKNKAVIETYLLDEALVNLMQDPFSSKEGQW